MQIVPRRCVPIVSIAVLSLFVLPFRGVASAAPTTSGAFGELATNPLVLTNSVTHAQAVMMPTRAWLAQHQSTSSVTSGLTSTSSTSSTSAALPSPACTLATDNSPGDATVLVNSSETQFDSLDLTAFGLASDASNITGSLSVESLSDGTPVNGTPAPALPAVAGSGDVWYLTWNYGNTPGVKGYFLEAGYPGAPTDQGYTNSAATSNLPVDFQWGEIQTSATGGDLYQAMGPATGTFDTTNNRLTITAPLSSLGAPPAGAVLSSPLAEGDALIGTSSGGLLETADKLASTSADYHVGNSGTSCPGPAAAPTAGSLPSTGSTNNLSYYGGPIVHTIQNHIIWWLPKAGTTMYSNGSSCVFPATTSYSYEQPASGSVPVGALPGGPSGDVDYQQIIRQYFQDLSGSAFYNLLGQYSDLEQGAPSNAQTFAGEWTDNCGYTSTPDSTTGPVPGGTQASPIYQTDIQAEVQRAIQINHWPTGLGNEYYVYTGYGAADCFASALQNGGAAPVCNTAGVVPTYCAYHGDFMDPSGNYVLYADMADGAFAANSSSINLCYNPPIGVTDPTHNVYGTNVTDPIADAEVSITSHEQFETANDAEVGTAQQLAPPLGWYDAVNGEIGDKCAYNYGNYAADGSNIVLNGDHYVVQQEYSNWNNGCGLTAYQGNGGYGGTTPSVAIQKGWNLISVPVSGITSTSALVSAMTAAGQLPAGSITEIQTYRNGKYQTYFPGKSKSFALSRTDGVLVQSSVAGVWAPSGSVYTSAPTIQLNQGWNLVAATYPNPGLTTDVIYNQIAAEAGACSAAIVTNQACSTTITEIKTIGAGGATIDWKPAAPDASGNATWPQTQGNQIPFTNGMWIYASKPLTWTVQGPECQTVDSAGQCH
jgi:hypothetical protein